MSDVFLRCTYDDDLPSPGPMYVTVELSASAPITSRILDRNVTEVVLFEVGRPGAATVIPGVNLGGPGAMGSRFPKSTLATSAPARRASFKSATFAAMVPASQTILPGTRWYSFTSR
jgi:hypothetical protein